ncbi:hypothetical protein TEA_018319 [Camellia sinensis var. sinensis]|uniref:NAD-dependent epimerase/dehydratase domain-containing protein n=1 Tax=Camellia sinensis var. sinensis TaxID=542762 RepID=A0A4S4EL49_CAMSN|nr:hypothetical protein TEA_018319 [Camellia sinensis var. sinensis]
MFPSHVTMDEKVRYGLPILLAKATLISIMPPPACNLLQKPLKGRDFPGIVIAEEPEWKDCIQGSNAVVNLAGMPISTRWSPEVVDLINGSQDDVRPTVLVSATALGYYGSSETRVFDEQSPSGNDYLAEVCREWEASALRVNKNVRLALIRIGVVLGKDGGALAKMIPLFMMFAGGPLGSGRQCLFTQSSITPLWFWFSARPNSKAFLPVISSRSKIPNPNTSVFSDDYPVDKYSGAM